MIKIYFTVTAPSSCNCISSSSLLLADERRDVTRRKRNGAHRCQFAGTLSLLFVWNKATPPLEGHRHAWTAVWEWESPSYCSPGGFPSWTGSIKIDVQSDMNVVTENDGAEGWVHTYLSESTPNIVMQVSELLAGMAWCSQWAGRR